MNSKAFIFSILFPFTAAAQYVTLWDVGIFDANGRYLFTDARPDGGSDALPGNPNGRDDHHYMTGSYPAPIGMVDQEHRNNFEAFLTEANPSNTIHFSLTQAQKDNGHFRLLCRFRTGVDPGAHPTFSERMGQVTFTFNGQEVFTSEFFSTRHREITQFLFDLPYASAEAGENLLVIERVGGTPGSELQISQLSMNWDPTGAADSDNDGLPRKWEENYRLSDSNPLDATLDPDGDSLNNLLEFQNGTNPLRADSDDDGLNDNEETPTQAVIPDRDLDGILDAAEPANRRNVADSDGDNASDSWEIATGYLPSDPASTPPSFSAIGLNFVSSAEQADRGSWDASAVNGFIPQQNWNQTLPLRSENFSSGDTSLYPAIQKENIISPVIGSFVDANGQSVSGMNFSYEARDFLTKSNAAFGTATTRLLNGLLQPTDREATLSLTGIPYANYDLYVYLAADNRNRRIRTSLAKVSLAGVSGSAQDVAPLLNTPSVKFQLPREGYLSSVTTSFKPLANVVKFENLTNSDLNIVFEKTLHDSGLAAIQIIDRLADLNGNSLPDYWEFQYALRTEDPDSDQVDNLTEFNNGSDPTKADTDNDGLTDLEEIAAGTDPSDPDSDGDTLSDFEELRGRHRSNPLLADSDGDGANDLVERRRRTDATDPSISSTDLPTPQVSSTSEFLWEITDLQLTWDHSRSSFANVYDSQPEIFYLKLGSNEHGTIFKLNLEERVEGLRYRIEVHRNGGFAPINTTPDAYNLEINGNAITDFGLREKMGFSGFGTQDTSHPFTVRFHAVKAGENWTLTISLFNQNDPDNPIISHVETDQVAHPNITNPPNGLTYAVENIRSNAIAQVLLTRSTQSLEIDAIDVDNDGIPDNWENLNNITDPLGNPDGDGLTNREEYFAGTNPNLADTDGDGVNDELEIAQFSDPTQINAVPPLYQSIPSLSGDFDGNGMRDSWEAQFGLTMESPSADSDGDGLSNLQESVAGTDPFDSSSRISVALMDSPIEGRVRMEWPSMPNKTETPSINLTLQPGDWSDILTTPSVTGGMSSLDLPLDGDQGFYRLEVSEKDSDNDGVSDTEELLLGSDPLVGNSIARNIPIEVPYDSNGDGTNDSTRPLPGDYAALITRFQNREELAEGNTTFAPTDRDLARLLMQGTFGPTLDAINEARSLGIEGWIDDQITAQEPTLHEDYIREAIANVQTDAIDHQAVFKGFGLSTESLTIPFTRAAVLHEDQLRQRVAFALSQFFVASFDTDLLGDKPQGMANYYDIFVRHAFGNYRDILKEVTFHPVMGSYLSHVLNSKADPDKGTEPDENFAREVMQLFSIGLWELNNDGSRKVIPGTGENIPSYDLQDITEMARVMTGLVYSQAPQGGGSRQDLSFVEPMRMWPNLHDFGEKRLLKQRFADGTVGTGTLIPARLPTAENGVQDIEDALEVIYQHPNLPPFFCRALIQFLVTHNPSPTYVEDIANIFIDNGSGVRGDMAAVIKAILMHREARDPQLVEIDPGYGRLRDPMVRFMHLLRMIGMKEHPNLAWRIFFEPKGSFGQLPLQSPSVFNFYVPEFSPSGPLAENNLVAGPFQILDITTAIETPDYMWSVLRDGIKNPSNGLPNSIDFRFRKNLSEILPYATDSDTLLDYLNLTVCGSKMSASTRKTIKEHIETAPLEDPRRIHHRIIIALYAAFVSPEGAIQR